MSVTETTHYLNDIELSKFEQFVYSLSQFTANLHEYAWIGVFISGVFIVSAWAIFRYHESKIEDYEFFKQNIHVVGRFTSKTFEMFRWWSKTFPPLSVAIVLFSIWTRFDTIAFIRVFGIKHVRDN